MSQMEKIKARYPVKDFRVMRDALFDVESGGKRFTRSTSLIQEALQDHGYTDLADKIANCKASNKCHNPYCDRCRQGLYAKQRKRFRENLSEPYQRDEAKIRQNVFFVTVLHELIPFDQPETDILRFPTTKVESAFATARKEFKAVRRTFGDKIVFVGAFELEPVNGLLVQLHPVKGKVLAEMAGTHIGLSDQFILVHSHFLVDLAGEARELFKTRLKTEWPATRQVDVSALYEDMAVSESLNRLADYPFKFPVRYYLRFKDLGLDQNVVVDGKTHNLNRAYTSNVIAQMVKGVAEIGTNALTIRMGASKAN